MSIADALLPGRSQFCLRHNGPNPAMKNLLKSLLLGATAILPVAQSANLDADAGITALQKIPMPQSNALKHDRFKDLSDWKNPYLIILDDGVEVLGNSTHIALNDLPMALANLPSAAWPYGRIVAIGEPMFRDPGDNRAVGGNSQDLSAVLKKLGVQVWRWSGTNQLPMAVLQSVNKSTMAYPRRHRDLHSQPELSKWGRGPRSVPDAAFSAPPAPPRPRDTSSPPPAVPP